MMSDFGFVLLAHLLYDFHWQGDFVATWKSKSWFILAIHALTYGLVICLTLTFLGIYEPWHLPFFVIGHFIIDGFKASGLWERIGFGFIPAIILDQVYHLLQLVIVIMF
jgi:hypothetical protein